MTRRKYKARIEAARGRRSACRKLTARDSKLFFHAADGTKRRRGGGFIGTEVGRPAALPKRCQWCPGTGWVCFTCGLRPQVTAVFHLLLERARYAGQTARKLHKTKPSETCFKQESHR